MEKRNHYSPEFKSQVVLEVLREEATVNEIATKYGVHPVMVSRWKQEFVERASEVFKKGPSEAEKKLEAEQKHVADLERKVGQLTYEVDWLKKNLTNCSDLDGRKKCVDPSDGHISISRQADLLEVNRSSLYRRPKLRLVSDEELHLMRLIDEIHTDEPTYGYRTITTILNRNPNIHINKKRVRRIMKDMGIYAIYPKPNLSKRYHQQYVRPYLLRKLPITRPNQVWGVDITYIRLNKGFLYLFVIIDWYSRYIVDYELSSTLDKSFVLACLKRAISNGKPEIINSDQGGHFTNPDYINLLESNEIKVSMDGKGQCLDNVRTERFFRTLKYDRIYINEYETPREIRAMLNEYILKYNDYRPHSSLGGNTPSDFYLPKCRVQVA
nr:IS3 family transposase [Fusibacter tunisiensis]